MTTRTPIACAIAALALAATAQADDRATRFEIVDFSDHHNIRADRGSLERGGFFNDRTMPNDDQRTREGVPFEFGPSHGPYAWSAYSNDDNAPSVRVLDIDTDLEGAVRVYTMLNTFWGTEKRGQLAIEFLGSDGAFHREELIGNHNVRDYNHNRRTTNRTNASNVREVFDNHHGQRIDMQTWDLPADFADETLVKIRVVDTGEDLKSRAMVWAITAELIDREAARAEALALIERARTERAADQGEEARELIQRLRDERNDDDTHTVFIDGLHTEFEQILPGGIRIIYRDAGHRDPREIRASQERAQQLVENARAQRASERSGDRH